jgi:hypothetical protein
MLFARVAQADWVMIAVNSSDATIGERIRARAAALLQKNGYDVLSQHSAAQIGPTVSEIQHCIGKEGECMRVALVATEVEQLLFFEVRELAGAMHLVARVYSGSTGELIREREHTCTRCSSNGALERSAEELTVAAVEIAKQPEPDTWLTVTTRPAAARVSIDGGAIEKNGVASPVKPGSHRVRATHRGYHDAKTTVNVAAGKTTAVHLHLVERFGSPAAQRYGMWKWAALGVGVGAGVLGVTGVMNDGPRFDGEGNREPRAWNTMGSGIAASLMSAVFLGLSGYMIWHDVAAVPDRRLVVTPAPSGMTLGWSSAF